MGNRRKHIGFSLTETLLAVGTLAIGMIFIGGTFLIGIHFSTIATERTIAAVVADEAFAKIRLYNINPTDPNLVPNKQTRFELLNSIDPEEFSYPSTKTLSEKQYYWSALCRPVNSNSNNRLVQVTVFVSRKVGSRTTYLGGAQRPIPIQVSVSTVPGSGNENKLMINQPDEETLINEGYTIVNNQTGSLYRVMQCDANASNIIILDRTWQESPTDSVWVVPSPIGGGKYPCIAVYQKLVRF